MAQLPQLPGSGQIYSTAYVASGDAGFSAVQSPFEALLLQWAGADAVDPFSQGRADAHNGSMANDNGCGLVAEAV